MSLSPYFHDLCERYRAELDDLTEDSEGRDVLQSRLKAKRGPQAFDALLELIELSPEMVAAAFHGAFRFPDEARAGVAGMLTLEPDEFPDWGSLSAAADIAKWAEPLVDAALARDEGAQFMCTVLALEYAVQHGARSDARAEQESDAADADANADDGADPDADDDRGEADAENFLEEQGFDRRSEQ